LAETSASADEPKAVQANSGPGRPVPHVPYDITPEEIAALAAAAAQLSGRAPVQSSSQEQISGRSAEMMPEPAAAASVEEAAPVTFANSPSVASQEAESVADAEHETPPSEAVGFAHAGNSAEAAEIAPQPTSSATENPDGPAPITAAEPVATQTTEPPEEIKIETPASAASEGVSEATSLSTEEPVAKVAEIAGASELPVVAENVRAAGAPPVADDEVMAAIQTLMPGPEGDLTNARPQEHSQGVALSAEVAGIADASNIREHSGPRWIAEEVVLSGDEAAISLEDEMHKADSTYRTEGVATTEPTELEPANSLVNAVSTEPAVVELATPQTDDQPAVYAMASAAAGGEAGVVPWTASANPSAHGNSAIENPAVHAEGASQTEAAANEASPIAANSDTNEIVGGTEVMAANWKNIRDSIAGAAAKPAPSKEHFEEPRTLKSEADVVAPLATERPASMGATDPTAIANIVESVLAELRPKIVEEIARKLADPKKS
jgi:hypothetical protein